MQDAPERIWVAGTPQECGQYFPSCVEAEGAWGGVGTEYTRTDLCITEAECQRRIDAAVMAEREACVDLADDVIRASNTLMLMLAGELAMTKPAVETALRRTLDARSAWDTAIRARGQK